MDKYERSNVNKISVILHTIIAVVLSLAYVLEFVKGARPITYSIMVAAIALIPVIVEYIILAKNKESIVIHHIVAISYSILYAVLLFTASSKLVFVYCLPMFFVVTMFSDAVATYSIAAGAVILNIAYVIYALGFNNVVGMTMADAEIQVASIVLVCANMVVVAIANKKIGDRNNKRIAEQQESIQKVSDAIKNESTEMTGDIETVAGNMNMLSESVDHIKLAMNEIASGTNETAASIQDQLEKTTQIQNHIATVKDTAGCIKDNMVNAGEMIAEGRKQMEELSAQVSKAMEANDKVITKMNGLEEYTEQMNTIIETITSIANSTGMLALNASIEAARAGEAGKGFAVVASQISELASQTKNATVNITTIIGNINTELTEVTQAIDEVTEGNKANVENTKIVVSNFESISKESDKVVEQTKELTSTLDELESANADIVDKIQTISAITEEVSAHTSETAVDCEANSELVAEIGQVVEKLDKSAETLKNIQ